MNSSTAENIPKDPETNNIDLQNKRSLKLLEECTDKIAISNQIIEKQANTSNNSNNILDVANKNLTKGDSSTVSFGGKTPAWFTDLQNCMSKYMQAHSGGETKNKSIELLGKYNIIFTVIYTLIY